MIKALDRVVLTTETAQSIDLITIDPAVRRKPNFVIVRRAWSEMP